MTTAIERPKGSILRAVEDRDSQWVPTECEVIDRPNSKYVLVGSAIIIRHAHPLFSGLDGNARVYIYPSHKKGDEASWTIKTVVFEIVITTKSDQLKEIALPSDQPISWLKPYMDSINFQFAVPHTKRSASERNAAHKEYLLLLWEMVTGLELSRARRGKNPLINQDDDENDTHLFKKEVPKITEISTKRKRGMSLNDDVPTLPVHKKTRDTLEASGDPDHNSDTVALRHVEQPRRKKPSAKDRLSTQARGSAPQATKKPTKHEIKMAALRLEHAKTCSKKHIPTATKRQLAYCVQLAIDDLVQAPAKKAWGRFEEAELSLTDGDIRLAADGCKFTCRKEVVPPAEVMRNTFAELVVIREADPDVKARSMPALKCFYERYDDAKRGQYTHTQDAHVRKLMQAPSDMSWMTRLHPSEARRIKEAAVIHDARQVIRRCIETEDGIEMENVRSSNVWHSETMRAAYKVIWENYARYSHWDSDLPLGSVSITTVNGKTNGL